MAARKTKLTLDWIVTTTGHGSEAGADPMSVRICRISKQCMCGKIFYLIKIHGQFDDSIGFFNNILLEFVDYS